MRWLAALLALYSLGLVVSTLQNPEVFGALWGVQVAAGLVFAGGFAWAFYRNRYVPALFAIWVVYSVLRLALFTQADYDRQRLPLSVALLVLVLIILVIIRQLRRDNTRNEGE